MLDSTTKKGSHDELGKWDTSALSLSSNSGNQSKICTNSRTLPTLKSQEEASLGHLSLKSNHDDCTLRALEITHGLQSLSIQLKDMDRRLGNLTSIVASLGKQVRRLLSLPAATGL